MKASTFEFRSRSWIITGIFIGAFSVYALGDQNLVVALLAWLKRWPAIAPVTAARAAFGLGAMLALLCALIRSWAAAYLNTRVVHDQQLHSSRLVADGPYRHLRNPLYLGTILLAFGFVPMTSRFGAPVLVVGISTFIYRLIRREESELLASQGEPFREYCKAVPSLLPSLAPRVPPSGGKPKWLQGLVGETMMWGFFVALAGFALTFSPRVYGFAVAFALLSSVVVKAAVWRRPKTPAVESAV
jgi:protein-S-isoprenylcysteine O-methyltransferase Ste14